MKLALCLPEKREDLNVVPGNGMIPEDIIEKITKGLFDIYGSDLEITRVEIQNAHVLNGKVYSGDICLSDFDMVFWYYILQGDLEAWDVVTLNLLSHSTKVVPNPQGLNNALGKLAAHNLLHNAGLPVANFAYFRTSQVYEMADRLSEWDSILLKPSLGAFGTGIHMVKDKYELLDAVQYAQSFSPQELYIFCEGFEENDLDKWTAVSVMDHEVMYGFRKKPKKFDGRWKVYDPLRIGGDVEYVDPSDVQDLAVKASQALGTDMVGFDFIYSKKRGEYIIVDENTFPGLYPECFEHSPKGSWSQYFVDMISNHIKMLKA